ncbi:MAG TPA: hypothetical protein VFG68_02555 [Fimbriiglobus sp.]|nr:hypothetical protein [Fimbriiglobus sp.]
MDWRAFAKKLILNDGRIDAVEALFLRRAIAEDGAIDRVEVEFLLDLRKDAKYVHPDFTRLLYKVLKRAVLRDGAIGAAEVEWLRKLIFGNYLAGPQELAFLEDLRREARTVHPDFYSLLSDAGGVTPAKPVRTRATPLAKPAPKKGRK